MLSWLAVAAKNLIAEAHAQSSSKFNNMTAKAVGVYSLLSTSLSLTRTTTWKQTKI